MKIKFYCKNHCADFEKTEEELKSQKQSFRYCSLCGEKLQILNLTEIVNYDIKIKVKENINKWVKQYGWDYVIDLIKSFSYLPYMKLYREELNNRGLNIKD